MPRSLKGGPRFEKGGGLSADFGARGVCVRGPQYEGDRIMDTNTSYSPDIPQARYGIDLGMKKRGGGL